MGIANQIDTFFQSTGQSVFIEAEAKPSTMRNFLAEYNSQFSPRLYGDEEGLITLQDDADKWGLELRLYFEDRAGIPAGVTVTSNRAYRSEWPYRFNDKNVIMDLFALGYHIGLN